MLSAFNVFFAVFSATTIGGAQSNVNIEHFSFINSLLD